MISFRAYVTLTEGRQIQLLRQHQRESRRRRGRVLEQIQRSGCIWNEGPSANIPRDGSLLDTSPMLV